MIKINPFRGSGVALATPFLADGHIDWDALKKMVQNILSGGMDFICVLGTTAETPTLTVKEQEEVKHFVVDVVQGKVPLLLGVGCNNTADVCRRLQYDDLNGFSGVLVVTPYYNKPSQRGLYAHYKTISEASPLPIMLYNVPGRTGVNLEPETTLKLAMECDNITAIKEASGNKEQIIQLIKQAPEGFDIISGDDALTFELLQEGAVGVISVVNNAFPKLFTQMVHLIQNNQCNEAYQIHNKLQNLYKLLGKEGNPSGLKALLSLLDLANDRLRLPLVSVSSATKKEIEIELSNIKYSIQ